MMIWSSVTRVGTGIPVYYLKRVSLEQFPAEGEQWDCNTGKCFKRLLCFVFLHNRSDFCRYMSWHGDAKFSREFCMEIPNYLGKFACGCQIPFLVGDTKNTEGVPKSLGDFTRGCRCYKEI